MTRLAHPSTAIDAASVIAWRLGAFAMDFAQPQPKGGAEAVRMVIEKQRAFTLGLIAAQEAWMRACLAGSLDLRRTAAQMTAAAEAPALEALRGNVRRMRRR